jgi:hypothetical protein
MPLDLYLGKQVKISVRTFTNEPAIVVGLEYDKARIGYSRVAFQLNDVIMPATLPASYLLTESGEYLLTEDGQYIEVE